MYLYLYKETLKPPEEWVFSFNENCNLFRQLRKHFFLLKITVFGWIILVPIIFENLEFQTN